MFISLVFVWMKPSSPPLKLDLDTGPGLDVRMVEGAFLHLGLDLELVHVLGA